MINVYEFYVKIKLTTNFLAVKQNDMTIFMNLSLFPPPTVIFLIRLKLHSFLLSYEM